MNRKNKIETAPHRVHSPDSRIVRVKTEGAGIATLRTLMIALILIAQILVSVYLYVEITFAFRSCMIISFILSGIACLHVLSSDKNSLSKAVWIIFLLLGFSFGYAVYFIADERVFFHRAKKKYRKIFKAAEKYVPEYREGSIDADTSVINDGKFLYNAGNFANYQNTACEYYPSGSSFFDEVLDACRGAEKFIFMEFFIISDGTLMNRFLDIIREKCREGVDVRIIFDDVGSHRNLSAKAKKKLRAAGAKIYFFNRLIPIFSVAFNYRDHRKIVVVDGKCAFTGGSNFADEYINEKRMFGYWKDTGIKLCGEAVDGFTLMFLRQWEYLSGKSEDYSSFLGHFEKLNSSSLVVPFADGLDYKAQIGKSAYENIISLAERRVYIMTPYFILDDTMTSLLTNKARSGVDVRIILPGIPDKFFVYGVSRNNAEKLIEHGVKVYTMDETFVHSKLVLTEKTVIVSSINMDLRSFYQQFECGVYTNDAETLNSVFSDFEESFKYSTLITEKNKKRRNILRRIWTGILQIFAPLM